MAGQTLGDLKLALRDIIGKRHAAVASTLAGRLYLPRLEAHLDQIEALPASLTSGRPLAEELGAEDVIHDGWGGAVYYMTEAYLRLPLPAHAPLREAASRVRAAFIPRLAELKKPYPDEAHAAAERAPTVAGHKPDLKQFPVHGGTLESWVTAFISSGKRIDELLSARGDVGAPDRSAAAGLRSGTIGLLGRFRDALADELDADPAALREKDAQIFGYYDELVRLRASQGEGAGAPPPPALDDKTGGDK